MPRLYRAVDAFVLPTRGEGWGLPVQEAMTMGLPTIATNWSGVTELIDEETGFPLRVDGLEAVSPGREYGATGREEWARPSTDHLRSLMREVFSQRDAAKKKGKRARQKMVNKFSQERVTSQVLSRFHDLVNREE